MKNKSKKLGKNFIKQIPKDIGKKIPIVGSGIRAIEETEKQILEEQRDNRLIKIDENIKKLLAEMPSSDSRSEEEIIKELELFQKKVWLDRHRMIKEGVNKGKIEIKPEIWEGALKAEKEMIKKYGKENLGPWDDFEWGMLNGKMSTLRWLLGDDWDNLDS